MRTLAIGSAVELQSLKSPITLTKRAFGAHTAKRTPVSVG